MELNSRKMWRGSWGKLMQARFGWWALCLTPVLTAKVPKFEEPFEADHMLVAQVVPTWKPTLQASE